MFLLTFSIHEQNTFCYVHQGMCRYAPSIETHVANYERLWAHQLGGT